MESSSIEIESTRIRIDFKISDQKSDAQEASLINKLQVKPDLHDFLLASVDEQRNILTHAKVSQSRF